MSIHTRSLSTPGLEDAAGAAYRLAGIVGFAALVALGARLSVPLWPVPITLQVPFVLLAGALLGARAGAGSMATYLAAGALGLPVFSAGGGPGYFLGPTGGYLVGFVAAAALVGLLAGPRAGARPGAGARRERSGEDSLAAPQSFASSRATPCGAVRAVSPDPAASASSASRRERIGLRRYGLTIGPLPIGR